MVENFALYVHWPWCVRKCPYCDFNSHAITHEVNESAYVDALLKDLEVGLELSGPRPITSVFFGGGTPSLMTEKGFARLLEGIASRAHLTEDCEITMEANPGTVESHRFASYAASGVNRFSIGIQSFDDRFLKTLGRIHDSRQAHEAVQAALSAVDNVNLDLMYALPGQTMDDLSADLETALSKGTTHLSCYELTIEEGTVFAKREPQGLPDSDLAADMNEMVWSATAKAGFEHYEISGYARPGRRCRHNLTYWTFGDYLGIGAGAHGKVTRGGKIYRTVRTSNPRGYLADANKGVFASQIRAVLPEDYPFEFALNVLRLTEGVPAQRWTQTTGQPIEKIGPLLNDLRRRGLLMDDKNTIAATDLGHRFLSDVQEEFLSSPETE